MEFLLGFKCILKELLLKQVGRFLKSFPTFLYLFLGVAFEPYKKSFRRLIGKDIPSIETYPSSEGFIAYQDTQTLEGMLLCVSHGIFYEFIPAVEYFNEKPKRLSLQDVKIGVDCVLILNTNATFGVIILVTLFAFFLPTLIV